METTKIKLRPYLAEYLIGKFNNGDQTVPIHFTADLDLYHIIWNLLRRRPKNVPEQQEGNVTIYLPDRRIGKDPRFYNYISRSGLPIIENTVRMMFNIELRQMLNDNRERGRQLQDKEIIYQFMNTYSIESISYDGLKKNYLRWRNSLNKSRKCREYKRC